LHGNDLKGEARGRVILHDPPILQKEDLRAPLCYCNQQAVPELLMHDKKVLEEQIYFILPLRIGKIQDIDLIKEVLNAIVN